MTWGRPQVQVLYRPPSPFVYSRSGGEHPLDVGRVRGSNPLSRTRTELNGFFKARRWDALRAWHITDFGNRCELGTIETQNTTQFIIKRIDHPEEWSESRIRKEWWRRGVYDGDRPDPAAVLTLGSHGAPWYSSVDRNSNHFNETVTVATTSGPVESRRSSTPPLRSSRGPFSPCLVAGYVSYRPFPREQQTSRIRCRLKNITL